MAEKTNNPATALLSFICGLLVFLAVIELIAANNPSIFEGASHRMLAKLAMFERKSKVDYVFFGTSRTQDGIAPRLVTQHLQELSPELNTAVGFNAAAPGESIDDLLNLAPRYLDKAALKVVLIELSTPHLANEPSLPQSTDLSSPTLETGLAAALQNLNFIKYRTAFRPGSVGSIISLLLFSSSMSGSESRVSDLIAAWRNQTEAYPENFDEIMWAPQIISPQKTVVSITDEQNKVADKLISLAQTFQKNNIQVIFYVPPASSAILPERTNWTAFYHELSRRTQADIWNFAALPLPADFFKDPTHLSRHQGQSHWSYALASQLAKRLRAK